MLTYMHEVLDAFTQDDAFSVALTAEHIMQVAEYAFTTLRPQLGMVHYLDTSSLAVADIPGLIKGASQNRGLGHRFLRHVERSHALAYVLDLSGGLGPDKGPTALQQLHMLQVSTSIACLFLCMWQEGVRGSLSWWALDAASMLCMQQRMQMKQTGLDAAECHLPSWTLVDRLPLAPQVHATLPACSIVMFPAIEVFPQLLERKGKNRLHLLASIW